MRKLKTPVSVRRAIDKYKKTAKGKLVYARAKRRFMKKNPNYSSKFNKRWRAKRKKAGLCPRCGKKRSEAYVSCLDCRKEVLENYHERKKE